MDLIETPYREISDASVMLETPLASVAMRSYNDERYIAQAIDGVLMQETTFPIELVIADDCSSDRTRDIVLEYQNKHPKLIRVLLGEMHVGLIKNTIRVEKACRGSYIAYCDADDFWHHPQKLQKQVEYLENHPECGLVYSDVDKLYEDSGKLIRSSVKAHHPNYEDLLNITDPFKDILVSKPGLFVCTSCVRKSLVDEFLAVEADLMLSPWIRQEEVARFLYFAHRSGFHFIPESLVTIRIRSESASRTKSLKKALENNESRIRAKRYFAYKYECSPEVRNEVDVKYYSFLLKKAYLTNDKALARNAYQGLRECGCRFGILKWAYYLGARSRVAKAIIAPFRLARRIVVQARRRHSYSIMF